MLLITLLWLAASDRGGHCENSENEFLKIIGGILFIVAINYLIALAQKDKFQCHKKHAGMRQEHFIGKDNKKFIKTIRDLYRLETNF
jgi:hypothetical protein